VELNWDRVRLVGSSVTVIRGNLAL
jgi:hypothetical protein